MTTLIFQMNHNHLLENERHTKVFRIEGDLIFNERTHYLYQVRAAAKKEGATRFIWLFLIHY